MLLYSAKFPVKETLTKDKFIMLVIEWNQGSPHDKLSCVNWDGVNKSLKFQEGSRSLTIEELRLYNVIAARFRKEDENKIVWTTDFVLNFTEKILAIRLDREVTEDTISFIPRFLPPHFVKLVIKNGFTEVDNEFPISNTPINIYKDNYSLIENVALRKKRYLLPIVYVTKTWAGNYRVDVEKLANCLQGVAHVLKEVDPSVSKCLMKSCNAENVHHGGIGIYFPSTSVANKKINTKKYIDNPEILTRKIVELVFRYTNQQRLDTMYTWEGVQNEILRLKNKSLQEKRERIEDENREIVDVFGEQLKEQEDTIKELNNKISSLIQENQGLRNKQNEMKEIPLLYYGEEDDFYEGEIREIVLDILAEGLKNVTQDSRRMHIILDLLEYNEFHHVSKERKNIIKQILKGYRKVSNSMKQDLQEFGFDITSEGKHYKLTYYRDKRYMAVMAKTNSDTRHGGQNLALEIDKKML